MSADLSDLRVSTIGFTKTGAENFFGRLKRAGVARVVDVRLHNTSQLAGFAKADDLRYFLRQISGIDYIEERHVEEKIAPETLQDACLLCSEDKPHPCHRRLVCEYLNRKWGGRLKITHL